MMYLIFVFLMFSGGIEMYHKKKWAKVSVAVSNLLLGDSLKSTCESTYRY